MFSMFVECQKNEDIYSPTTVIIANLFQRVTISVLNIHGHIPIKNPMHTQNKDIFFKHSQGTLRNAINNASTRSLELLSNCMTRKAW